MLNTQNQYRLVFCTDTTVPGSRIIQALNDNQFIGNSVFSQASGNSSEEFFVGNSFLSAITFMGCSPYIEFEAPSGLEPNDKAEFCFVRFSSSRYKSAMYHAGQFDELKTVPRCQHCRKIISDWSSQAEELNTRWQLSCSYCCKDLTPSELDWRKASGLGNFFIEVLNVYLQEGVPTEAFLNQLEESSESKWNYFYTNTNLKTMSLDRT